MGVEIVGSWVRAGSHPVSETIEIGFYMIVIGVVFAFVVAALPVIVPLYVLGWVGKRLGLRVDDPYTGSGKEVGE